MGVMLAGLVSCGGVYKDVRETPGPTETKLVASGTAPLTVSYAFEKGPPALTGTVRFSTTCSVQAITVIHKTETTTNTTTRGTGVVSTIVGGVLLGGGIGGMVGWVPRASDVQDCSKDANGQESCSSPREAARAVSITGIVLGGIVVGAGVIMLAAGVSESHQQLADEHRVKTTDNVPCGKPQELEGLEVALLGAGSPRVAKVDASGKFRVDLAGEKPQKSATAQLVVHTVPPPIGDRVKSGALLGAVDAAAWLATVDADAAAAMVAARKAADDHPFTGVVHGDQAARDGFTTACTPAGKEVCGNAIDDDCDGEVDLGCGIASGALQWTLAWPTDDDLDLHVIGPDGEEVFAGHPNGGASGLALDASCAGAGCPQRIENVTSPRDKKPVFGTYRAWVVVKKAMVSDDPSRTITGMLGGRIGGHSFRLPLSLVAQDGARINLAFAVGPDGDKDSVIEEEDKCPAQAGPWSDFPEDRGCPDGDHDGVSDGHDACPADPGIRTNDPKTHGCPKIFGNARLTARGVEITGTIQFATGKSEVLAASFKTLEDIAKVMIQEPQALQLVAIEGHTDSMGDRAANMKLSRDRVKSVLELLVKKHGVGGDRLTTNWFGPDRPIADNATEPGRAKNRRVEFRVIRPEPKAIASW